MLEWTSYPLSCRLPHIRWARPHCERIAAFIIAIWSFALFVQPVHAKQPKLMLLVVIDQFRYDYLLRFRDQYTGGYWYDRESRKRVLSVSDETVKVLGGNGDGASPHRLLVSTLGDEIKMAHLGSAHVVGISLKDRSAILPAGRMADAAYWYDAST